MDPISLEDLALNDVLRRVDRGEELTAADDEMRKRLLDSALILDDADGLRLSPAGVELCKSFQHRVAADKQAKKILERRNGASKSS